MAAALPIEIKFAQNLAGNEKKIRYKAVKKLRKFLKAKSSSKKDGFTEEDFLKLWKGLHYCMWMQDKPLVQEELCTMLTQLVHNLSTTEAKMLFIKVFFMTEAREWNSIDVWRLDKFMMLVRSMLNESLVMVKKLQWEQTQLGRLMEMYAVTIMNPESDTIPDGLKIHFTDIYLDEVETVGEGRLTGSQLLNLLVPFVKFIQKEKNNVLVRRVISRIFDPVVARVTGDKRDALGQTADAEGEKEADVQYRTLEFDGKLLADYLFDVSQQNCVLNRNRPLLYNIVTKLQDIEKGVFPTKREIVIPEGITHKEMQQAVNSLVSLEQGKKRKKKRKKNKKEKKERGEVNENADPNNNEGRTNIPNDNPSIQQKPSTSSHIGEKRKLSLTDSDKSDALTKIKKKKVEEETSPGDETKLKKLKSKFAKLDLRKGKEKRMKSEDKETLLQIGMTEKMVNSTVSDSKSVGKDKTYERINPTGSSKSQEGTGKIAELKVNVEIPPSSSKKGDVLVDTPKRHNKHSVKDSEHKSSTDKPDSVSAKAWSQSVCEVVPEIVINEASPTKVQDTQAEDGEIEVFTPNKKFKGTSLETRSKDKTPLKFAAFDGSRAPVAFVKRSLSKLKRTPSSLKAASMLKTPGEARTPGSRKHVTFNMKKNKAQGGCQKWGQVPFSSLEGFKESLSSPITPFDPLKTPESGILKSATAQTTPAQTMPVTPEPGSFAAAINSDSPPSMGSRKRKKDLPHVPVTRQTLKHDRLLKTAGHTPPVVTVGFGKKTPVKRMTARDFFL